METVLERARELVEQVLGALGVTPAEARIAGEPDLVAYRLKRGSARLTVSLSKRDGISYFRVAARMLEIGEATPPRTPIATSREALFARLLQLNASGLANAAFGLEETTVVLLSERPVAGLDAFEVDQIIRHVAILADGLDARLQDEFRDVARPRAD